MSQNIELLSLKQHNHNIASHRPKHVNSKPIYILDHSRIDFAGRVKKSKSQVSDNPISKNGNFRSGVLTDETKGQE